CGVELRPIALPGQLGDVVPDLAGVIAELGEPLLVVPGRQRLQVRLAGELRIDDDGLGTGELDDEVGAETAVFGRHMRLSLEVAVLEHPGHLDDSPELDLAPAPADVGP